MSQEISIIDLIFADFKSNEMIKSQKGVISLFEKQIIYNEMVGSAIYRANDTRENRVILHNYCANLSATSSSSVDGVNVESLSPNFTVIALKSILDRLPLKPTGGDTFGPAVSRFRIDYQIENSRTALAPKSTHGKIAKQVGSRVKKIGSNDLPPGGTF